MAHQMTLQEGIENRAKENEAIRQLISEVHVTKGILGFSKTVGCGGCSERVEVTYSILKGDEQGFQVWEIQGDTKVLCADCADKFSMDENIGHVDELSLIEWCDLDGESHRSFVAPETAEAIVSAIRRANDEDDADIPTPSVDAGAAHRIKHFGNLRVMRGGN